MGKLVEGNVLPATLGEVAAYFSHVLGDPRATRDNAPRVLIAIQCDRCSTCGVVWCGVTCGVVWCGVT
jgi:hypothetical protein